MLAKKTPTDLDCIPARSCPENELHAHAGAVIFCMKLFILLIFSGVLIAGCLAPPGPPPGNYSSPQLKYLLLDHYHENQFFFCDPDYYPISRDDEAEKALEFFPVIQNSTDEFNAILLRKGLQAPFSNESKLTIYREYKKLRAIPFTSTGVGTYSYIMQLGTEGEGRRVSGIIRTDGTIIEQRSENVILTCPICLAEGTRIDTPDGPVPVNELQAGMIVWTCDAQGVRIPVPVLRTARTPAPTVHHVVHLELADGRSVEASAGHPTTDGRTLDMLSSGDLLDGAVIIDADLVPYGMAFVYDILPAGDTANYWANGILLKSTLC